MKDKHMKIQLNQAEITKAIRQYVLAQGTNLTGKTLTTSFTAGRKEGGLIADLTIDDVADTHIPGFTTGDTDLALTGEPTNLVSGDVNATKSETSNVTGNDSVVAEPDAPVANRPAEKVAEAKPAEADPAPVAETAAEKVEVPADATAEEAKPVASLFGN